MTATAEPRTAPATAPERMSGSDAEFWHAWTTDAPFHTLKVLVLDPAYRGRPLTLAEMVEVLPRHLGLVPRATQKVVSGPGYTSRPFWVEDDRFDVRAHLDERTLAAPGGRPELDALCADLAVEHLDRSHPLWAATLVHGLADGRQAVVVRVHHCVMDGMAAINAFRAVTASGPGEPLPLAPAPWGQTAGHDDLAATARATRTGLATRARALRTAWWSERQATRGFEGRTEVPQGLTWRSSLNSPSGSERVCASTTLDLDALKRLARARGATLNGAFHAVLGEALREELADRGERVDRPLVALFSVAADRTSSRTQGNSIASALSYLHVQLPDRADRIEETAHSCALAVDLRRRAGFALREVSAELRGRALASLRPRVARFTPRVLNHVTTANVAGPDHIRWLGDLPVVGWTSYAVAVAPADVNVTAHSYNGRIALGLVTTPESMPDPDRFLQRVRRALSDLADQPGNSSGRASDSTASRSSGSTNPAAIARSVAAR